MFGNRRVTATLLSAIAVVLFIPPKADAEDADTREVMSYALTEAGLAKYTQATRKLSAFASQLSDCEDEDESPSLDATVARLNAVPGVKAAIESAGMTTREYTVFLWSLIHNGLAAWAASQPGGSLPPGASKANVDFYQKHEAEIQSLSQQASSGDCDEAYEEEYDEEYDDEG